MKTSINTIIVFFIICVASSFLPQKTAAQQVSVDFQVFYDELSPYGSWIENPAYGYVWIPDVEAGFTPYATNGYWVFTEDGWTWVSDYPWGWAPFHYGRWYTDPMYGPMWIPDNVWGPGWVSWRQSEDYYGWAPMGPGISISMSYGNGYNEHFNDYTFVRGSYFGRRDMHNYYVSTTNNVTIINNTTVINNSHINAVRNSTYNAGPDRTEVEKRGGKKISQVAIIESNKPGENLSKDQLKIYRPQLKNNTATEVKSAPAKVQNLKDVKTSEQRSKEVPTQKLNQPSQQRIEQPAKQQPKQQQRNVQPARQQPVQQRTQPARQQPVPQKRINQPAKQQPMQRPAQQQPTQQQRSVQPQQQRQLPQQQRNVQPVKQQPAQQQRNVQPTQPTQQPQQTKPAENTKEEKRGR
ncbi:MAG: hypothetical protein HXX18_02260 [Bacteroidetes bacterium]|nr:hypothetical protein [Bacteroidota bacterium]